MDYQLKQAVIFRRKEGSQLRRFIYPPTHPPNISSSFRWSSSSSQQSINQKRERESLSWIQNLSFGQIHILPLSLYIYILEFLMVDSYSNLSWLVWIQMFVFFLLLCVFGLLSSDVSESSVSSSDSLPSTSASGRFLSGDPIPISHHRGLGFSVVQSNQVNS